MPLPDEQERVEILQIYAKDNLVFTEMSIQELARRTEGYSGADLKFLVRSIILLSVDFSKVGAVKEQVDVENGVDWVDSREEGCSGESPLQSQGVHEEGRL